MIYEGLWCVYAVVIIDVDGALYAYSYITYLLRRE